MLNGGISQFVPKCPVLSPFVLFRLFWGPEQGDLWQKSNTKRDQDRTLWDKLGNAPIFGDRKGTTKKLCDKDFAERSGEFSGAICLKTLVLLGNDR